MLPIVFINLDGDVERRHRMELELARLKLDGQRFDATRWTQLPPDEQARLYSPELNAQQFHKSLVNGEKGCYASHLRCWQMLLSSDAPALVVLEDDVGLQDGFAEGIAAIEALAPGWDMIKLIGREREKLLAQRPLGQSQYQLVDYRRVPSLTAGYVISRTGAAKLLASRQPFGRPIDVDLRHWWESGLRVQGVMPALLRLDETSFASSIGTKESEAGLLAKWRKFRRKLDYTVQNTWHNLRRRA